MSKLRASFPGAVQAVGALGAVAGLYLLTGLAWTLLCAGVAVLAVGVMAERNQ